MILPLMTAQQLEDERLIEELTREQDIDAAIALRPVQIRTGKLHIQSADGEIYQKCGGGRRIIRKTYN